MMHKWQTCEHTCLGLELLRKHHQIEGPCPPSLDTCAACASDQTPWTNPDGGRGQRSHASLLTSPGKKETQHTQPAYVPWCTTALSAMGA
eukprot:1160512-Pelagomonas_calceolata.AAC.7